MERPLWAGQLVLGIVSIPVRLFAAVRDHDLHFHQISRAERKRIRYRKVAEGSDEEVPEGGIVKGYEVKPGQYVVFDEAELARLASRRSRVIEISSFVALVDIDPLYFDRPYRVLPDEHGEKAHRLLTAVLERTERVGIAQLVMHGKEHIVALRSLGGGLILHTLRFADEIVRPEGGPRRTAGTAPAEREVAMAERLVESMHGEFDAGDFHDDYRERLKAAIARKARGKTIAVTSDEEEEPRQGNVISLMDALERSLAKRPAPRGRPAAGGKVAAAGKAKPRAKPARSAARATPAAQGRKAG